jgi:hypothetical protein
MSPQAKARWAALGQAIERKTDDLFAFAAGQPYTAAALAVAFAAVFFLGRCSA